MSAEQLLRADQSLIADLVPVGARVLDLGCGDGALIARLRDEHGAYVRGVEIDLEKIGHGVLFEGSSGCLVADFQSRFLMPRGNESDLTYYHPRSKAAQFPPMGNFQQEWINACKGSLKTSCDFGYASDMIEMMLLGLVAYRAGRKIKYDGATGRVTDCPEANELLHHTYRDGWTLNG